MKMRRIHVYFTITLYIVRCFFSINMPQQVTRFTDASLEFRKRPHYEAGSNFRHAYFILLLITYGTVVTIFTTHFDNYITPTQCIYVFRGIFTLNGNYFLKYH